MFRQQGPGGVVSAMIPKRQPCCIVVPAMIEVREHIISRTDHGRLASMAFRNILGIKQSSYGQVVAWLDERIASCQPRDAGEANRLRRIVQKGNRVFGGYRF